MIVSDKHTVSMPNGWTLIHREESGSTNVDCRALVANGAAHGTVLWVDRQTAGRGRQDRTWESTEGNLTFSVILRPDCSLADSGKLSFICAVALCEAIESLSPHVSVKCKWPNDVLGAKGKLAGILLEGCGVKAGKPEAVICGIGLNITWRPGLEALYPPSSLWDEGATNVTQGIVLEAFLACFSRWVDLWLEQGFEPVREAWMQRARGLGELINVRLPNETLQGIFETLDVDGGLVLSGVPEGQRVIRAGDVFFG